MKKIRIVIGQLNFLVGDIQGNVTKIIAAAHKARDEQSADLIVFPELALTGYPPEDLLLRQDFHEQVQQGIKILKQEIKGIDIIFGYPQKEKNKLYNALLFIANNEIIAKYYKQQLPNYGVFDEKRYFTRGKKTCVVNYKGVALGLIICEDLWFPRPTAKAKAAGAQLIICINASPFDIHKLRERERIMKSRIEENRIAILYAHCVGGQDELVFDGRSMVMDQDANLTHLGPVFAEGFINVDVECQKKLKVVPGEIAKRLSDEARAYNALVLGVRDYIEKNNFPGVLVGLSGGIDSALTLAIAVDALGAERVRAVLMPSRYTADISIEDAKRLAENLSVNSSIISIEESFKAFLNSLSGEFTHLLVDTTEENIQARCRAVILMALSNKFGHIVLTTGNKSEMAVGYGTLYGDMAGGFAVLKDVYKTLVYSLACYRNKISDVIPQRIIDRAPSAELALNQTDQDILPPYEILDQILELYVEEDKSLEALISQGFDEAVVRKILKMVDRNEYKRRQGPPGVKITTRAFGRDRRYPITSGFSHVKLSGKISS